MRLCKMGAKLDKLPSYYLKLSRLLCQDTMTLSHTGIFIWEFFCFFSHLNHAPCVSWMVLGPLGLPHLLAGGFKSRHRQHSVIVHGLILIPPKVCGKCVCMCMFANDCLICATVSAADYIWTAPSRARVKIQYECLLMMRHIGKKSNVLWDKDC